MFKFADNCTEALMLSREAFFGLYDNYNKLEEEAIAQRDSASQAKFERDEAKGKLAMETGKKKKWIRLAIGEGVLIVGTIVGVATGAWVPVAAIVVVTEIALIMDAKPPSPKLSISNVLKDRIKL
jgi:hypothetical protein